MEVNARGEAETNRRDVGWAKQRADQLSRPRRACLKDDKGEQQIRAQPQAAKRKLVLVLPHLVVEVGG